MVSVNFDRHIQTEVVTTDEQRERAAKASSVVLMQNLAKSIRRDAIDIGDISPMLEAIEGLAAPVPALATDLRRIRSEWNTEDLSNMDVANDLQKNAEEYGATRMVASKGPDADLPLARPEVSRGR